MEKSKSLVTVPLKSYWSDLGDWSSIWQHLKPDKDGVVTSGKTVAIDCKNSLLRSEVASQQLVALNVENLVAVSMPDAVLVAQKVQFKMLKKL